MRVGRIMAVLAVAVVAAGAWSLRRPADAEPGPLAPLAWLVGGEWRPEVEGTSPTRAFAWSSAGLVLRETREDTDGAPAGEVIYHWHHEKGEVALYGVLPAAHFEGVLRATADGALEGQWRLYQGADEPTLYREYLRPVGPNRLIWTLHHRQEDEEFLAREAILVRRRN